MHAWARTEASPGLACAHEAAARPSTSTQSSVRETMAARWEYAALQLGLACGKSDANESVSVQSACPTGSVTVQGTKLAGSNGGWPDGARRESQLLTRQGVI